MEKEELEQKMKKNIYDRIGEIILLIAVALIGVSSSTIKDMFGWSGVALAWVALGFGYLIYDDLRIRAKNKEMVSDDKEKKKFDELFLSQMIDKRVISGQDLSIPPLKSRGYYSRFQVGQTIEFLAFSQKKFTLYLFDSNNYQKLSSVMNTETSDTIDMTKYGIQPELGYDAISFVKNRHTISKTDTWIFWVRGVEGSEKEEFKINLLISYV